MSMATAGEWNVLYTYPNSEKKVRLELERLNVKSYLPLHTVIRKWSDRMKKVDVPLFPNYIFIQIDATQKFKVLGLANVVRLLSFEGRLARVSQDEIEIVRKAISNAHLNVLVEKQFIPGDEVKITQGPLEGLTGTVSGCHHSARFFIELKTINQVISVDISPAILRKTTSLVH